MSKFICLMVVCLCACALAIGGCASSCKDRAGGGGCDPALCTGDEATCKDPDCCKKGSKGCKEACQEACESACPSTGAGSCPSQGGDYQEQKGG